VPIPHHAALYAVLTPLGGFTPPPTDVTGRSPALVRGDEISDLSGGIPQLLIAQLRRHTVLLSQRKQAA
jgi:hypothetical protein